MKKHENKKTIIIIGIILVIVIAAAGILTQSSRWSRRSFEAIVRETILQSDGEIRLLVERTTEIYGNPLNSLGIGQDTAFLDADGKKISLEEIPPGSSVKVTLKDTFTEETPYYYPVVYEIRLIQSGR